MAFKIFPTSVAGVQLPFNQLKGPLAKLWANDTLPNLYYPQDIGTNPAHCHVVQISIYEYTTDFEETVMNGGAELLNSLTNQKPEVQSAVKDALNKAGSINVETLKNTLSNYVTQDNAKALAEKTVNVAQATYSAKTYRTRPGGDSLANISLYMPDSLNVDYNATYSSVELTKTLGPGGYLASALSEMGGIAGMKGKSLQDIMKQAGSTAAAKGLAKSVAGTVAEKLGMSGAGDVLGQIMHQVTNPQLQLIYQGTEFRQFQLDFIFTPKSSYEAEMTKQIIDTLVYYSSPGIGGQNTGDQQQYLVPPQIFNVKFLFTGKNGVEGALGSVFNKALNNVGLDFLTSESNRLSVNQEQNVNTKLFEIGDCVLRDVAVDYAPNGWAAFDDGHPIQTRVSLRFQEMNIVTKERLKSGKKPPVNSPITNDTPNKPMSWYE